MHIPKILKNDPYLKPFEETIIRRLKQASNKEKELLTGAKSLAEFAHCHDYYGLHKEKKKWIFREWAPNATEIYLVGEFTEWKRDPKFALKGIRGIWEIELPLKVLKHGMLYRLEICWNGGEGGRIPAHVRKVIQDDDTKIFNAQVWDPKTEYVWKNLKYTIPKNPIIYEAHIGMAGEEGKVSSYKEFTDFLLPRIAKAGYNTIQLMAIQEHPYYGSFGYHVSNFFAPTSRFGTPEELKALVDAAHGLNIAVIMDIVHSHAVKNEIEGLSKFDGSLSQYFYEGQRGDHHAWDSRCFDYGKREVIRFLLSNCKYWIKDFNFDGYRFDGVTSMLYWDHGLSRAFTCYDYYFDAGVDENAVTYLILANKLIHELKPDAMTIAEEMSGMPGLATSLRDGGIGFDYRLAMGIPDYWIKIIKEVSDDNWDIVQLFYELTSRRSDEKTISYAESHDQALVGDKTLIFRLLDKEMYENMNCESQSLIIDRGIALHKLIRLITIATGGSGYLNFMGNEFGHPEWIDFPREGNNWSFHYARRQWSLVDNKKLRYKKLGDFDQSMIKLIRKENVFNEAYPYLMVQNVPDKILVFRRNGILFVFNFSPTQSYTDYAVETEEGEYKIILNSDAAKYDGFGRIDDKIKYISKPLDGGEYYFPSRLMLYLPARVALVFKKV